MGKCHWKLFLVATILFCSHVNSNPIKNGTDVDPQPNDPNENTVVLEEKSKANPDGGANTNIETKKTTKEKVEPAETGKNDADTAEPAKAATETPAVGETPAPKPVKAGSEPLVVAEPVKAA